MAAEKVLMSEDGDVLHDAAREAKALLNQNYFSLFDLPQNYEILPALLTRRYLVKQKQFHPDTAGGDEHKQRLLMQCSSKINEAFNVLLSPIKRAEYMLSLYSDDVTDINSLTLKDSEFLIEQMMLRKKLQQFTECHGVANDTLEGITDFAKNCAEHLSDLEKQFATLWCTGNGGDVFKSKATMLIQKMCFFSKLITEADELEAEVLDQL